METRRRTDEEWLADLRKEKPISSGRQLARSLGERTSVISGIVHFRSNACEALVVSS